MPRGSWLVYTWVDFKSDFVSPQHEGRRPSPPPEENNGKCGPMWASPAPRLLEQVMPLLPWLQSPLSSFFSSVSILFQELESWGKEWERQPEVLKWSTAKGKQCLGVRGNCFLNTTPPHFSFCCPSESQAHHLSNSTFSTMIQGCVLLCLFNIYSIFTVWPISCCIVPVIAMNRMLSWEL